MDLYREQMLDHYKNPSNYKIIPNPTHQAHGINPLCGDEIDIFLIVKNHKIIDVGFQSQSCAITMATASLVTEQLINKNVNEIKKFSPEKLDELLGTSLSTSRVNCALVVINTLKQALSS